MRYIIKYKITKFMSLHRGFRISTIISLFSPSPFTLSALSYLCWLCTSQFANNVSSDILSKISISSQGASA